MSVTITVAPSLQSLIGNVKTIQVEGQTVAGCLEHLIEKYPQLAPEIFITGQKVSKKLSILLNGENIYPTGTSRTVKDGDKLYIFDILAGG